ncbi:MAG TPA: alpha/beta hydrolase, partial [Gaiellales bacterium]|nr:alpha/beta hydrolase [Gaiellales bacterium]
VPYLDGFRLVLLDHRGRGRSDRPAVVAQHAIEEYVADVVAVLDELAVERCGFVGYSMGAQIGQLLAASHPQRVSALVALGVTRDRVPDPLGEAAFAAEVRSHGMVRLVDEVEREERIVLPVWLRDQFLETDREQFALGVEAMAAWTPWAIHASIRCPALLVAGELEDPARRNGEAAALMVRGAAAWLPGLGHVGAFLAAEQQCRLFVPHLRRALPAVSHAARSHS